MVATLYVAHTLIHEFAVSYFLEVEEFKNTDLKSIAHGNSSGRLERRHPVVWMNHILSLKTSEN